MHTPDRNKFIFVLIAFGVLSVFVFLIAYLSKTNGLIQEYKGNNVAFQYPSSWNFQPCREGVSTFVLPEQVYGTYKTDNYPLVVKGMASKCQDGKVAATMVTRRSDNDEKSTKCAPQSYEELKNGLFIHFPAFQDNSSIIWSIEVAQYACGPALFTFKFDDPKEKVGSEQILRYGGEPRIKKDTFIASKQYHELKQFAESIKVQ